MKKMYCWDPRLQAACDTDNPALIFADLMANVIGRRTFWAHDKKSGHIAWLADYCDQKVIKRNGKWYPLTEMSKYPGGQGIEFHADGKVKRIDSGGDEEETGRWIVPHDEEENDEQE